MTQYSLFFRGHGLRDPISDWHVMGYKDDDPDDDEYQSDYGPDPALCGFDPDPIEPPGWEDDEGWLHLYDTATGWTAIPPEDRRPPKAWLIIQPYSYDGNLAPLCPECARLATRRGEEVRNRPRPRGPGGRSAIGEP